MMEATLRQPLGSWTLLLRLAALTLLATAAAHATDIRHWQREPIAIDLPVGSERIVVFNQPVRVGLPPVIADPAKLRVQSTGGAVYLLAKQPFDTQRVQIQVIPSGRIILVDLTAKEHASSETIRVEFAQPTAMGSAANRSAQPAQSRRRPIPPAAFGRTGTGAPTPIRLVRHAAQALYAPQRLVTDGATGIHRIAVAGPLKLHGLLPTYPVEAQPLAAWRARPYTVTAVQVTNRGTRSFALDPRGLAAGLYAASFMHRRLGPAGTLRDTTTLFAVTRNSGLAAALAPTVNVLAEADDED